MKQRTLATCALLALGVLSAAAADRTFDVTGTVRGRLDDGRLIIEHSEMRGYMPAMTMAFDVADPKSTEGIETGDSVRFRYRVSDDSAVAEGFVVTGRVAPNASPARASIHRLHEGDAVSPFRLVDERGAPLTQASLLGHRTIVTFIFTRCPVPEFCPAMALKFASIQKELAARGVPAGSVRLLSVTLDPEFDSPEILRIYGDAVGADPAVWGFATGEKSEAEALARAFSVYVERDGALLNHTLCTALIGPDGRVQQLWRGNGWKTDEVIAALQLPPAG